MYYFAYGSNLNRKQMAERCPESEPRFLIFTGWSRQWRSGTASIKPFQGQKVPGAVYELSERDLRLLDRHEGYPALYNRMNVLVITEEGEAVRAVTYIKREQSEETRPTMEYLAVIQQGYRDWEIT